MAATEELVERLKKSGGLEELPAATTALQKLSADLTAVRGQRNRLRPEVLASEETAIAARAIEQVNEAYERTIAERLKTTVTDRGRIITDTAGVDTMSLTGAERRALENQWAAEIPAALAALPFIDSVEEIEDFAEVVFTRNHALAIRCLTPALLKQLSECADPTAKAAWARLSQRFSEWRKGHPTHRARIAALDAREAAIRSGLSRSRDLLLEAHGLKQTPVFRG